MWRSSEPLVLTHDASASLLPNNLSAGRTFCAYARHGDAMLANLVTGVVAPRASPIFDWPSDAPEIPACPAQDTPIIFEEPAFYTV